MLAVLKTPSTTTTMTTAAAASSAHIRPPGGGATDLTRYAAATPTTPREVRLQTRSDRKKKTKEGSGSPGLFQEQQHDREEEEVVVVSKMEEEEVSIQDGGRKESKKRVCLDTGEETGKDRATGGTKRSHEHSDEGIPARGSSSKSEVTTTTVEEERGDNGREEEEAAGRGRLESRIESNSPPNGFETCSSSSPPTGTAAAAEAVAMTTTESSTEGSQSDRRDSGMVLCDIGVDENVAGEAPPSSSCSSRGGDGLSAGRLHLAGMDDTPSLLGSSKTLMRKSKPGGKTKKKRGRPRRSGSGSGSSGDVDSALLLRDTDFPRWNDQTPTPDWLQCRESEQMIAHRRLTRSRVSKTPNFVAHQPSSASSKMSSCHSRGSGQRKESHWSTPPRRKWRYKHRPRSISKDEEDGGVNGTQASGQSLQVETVVGSAANGEEDAGGDGDSSSVTSLRGTLPTSTASPEKELEADGVTGTSLLDSRSEEEPPAAAEHRVPRRTRRKRIPGWTGFSSLAASQRIDELPSDGSDSDDDNPLGGSDSFSETEDSVTSDGSWSPGGAEEARRQRQEEDQNTSEAALPRRTRRKRKYGYGPREREVLPSIEDWSEVVDSSSPPIAPPAKKRRGRPRKSESPASVERTAVDSSPGSVPVKRRRGRPRKSETPSPSEQSVSPASSVPVKRRRGRPRKSETPSPSEQSVSPASSVPVKRRLGRPRKSETPSPGEWPVSPASSSGPVKRRRGRPRKSETPVSVGRQGIDSSPSSVPVKKRRGRPRKSETPVSVGRQGIDSPTTVPVKKRLGRPRKSEMPVSVAGQEVGPPFSVPVKRGPGRPRKTVQRVTFSDKKDAEVEFAPEDASAREGANRPRRSCLGSPFRYVPPSDGLLCPSLAGKGGGEDADDSNGGESACAEKSVGVVSDGVGPIIDEEGSSSVVHRTTDTSWAESTALRQGSELNVIQTKLLELVRNLRRKCDPYSLFSHPVDPEEDDCDDYFDVVDKAEAMDLGTMEGLVRSGALRDIDDFRRHVDRIVDCARRYNDDPDNWAREEAEKFAELAYPKIEKTRKTIERMCSLHVGNKRAAPVATEVPQRKNRTCGVSGNAPPQPVCETVKSPRKQPSPDVSTCASAVLSVSSGATLVSESSMPSAVMNWGSLPACKKDLAGSTMKLIKSRKQWLRLCPEMLSLCNEAARRAAVKINPTAGRYDKPLSEAYMTERLSCHLPVRGFIVFMGNASKNSCEPHLQGFLVTNSFISWRKTFRWEFDAPHAGITPQSLKQYASDDGTLTAELKASVVQRDGERGCIVFPRIAEISLLGGLGCGGALVRAALADLRKDGQYDYVVLQSTKMAITFYEKLGFRRVGAVARFYDREELPEVPYRHWGESTGRNACEASHMMAIRLNGADTSADRTGKCTGGGVTLSQGQSAAARTVDVRKYRDQALGLIEQIIPIQTGMAGGSFTFKELLAVARQLASYCGEESFVRSMDEAREVYLSTAPKPAKRILTQLLESSREGTAAGSELLWSGTVGKSKGPGSGSVCMSVTVRDASLESLASGLTASAPRTISGRAKRKAGAADSDTADHRCVRVSLLVMNHAKEKPYKCRQLKASVGSNFFLPPRPAKKRKKTTHPLPRHTQQKNADDASLEPSVLPRGVYKTGNRYCAKMFAGGKSVHLGTYDSPRSASNAFREAYKLSRGQSPDYLERKG